MSPESLAMNHEPSTVNRRKGAGYTPIHTMRKRMGEFLILLGTFRVHPVYAIVAVTGIVWAAWYMLAMLRRVLFGPIVHPENASLADLTWNERIVLIPILFLIVWIGVYPAPFLRRMEASVERVIVQVERQQMVHSSGFIVQGRLATNYEASTMKPSPVHGSEFIVQGGWRSTERGWRWCNSI